MALQTGQNISDTVSPLDKLLQERQEECWVMLNRTFTTVAPGKSLGARGLVLSLWGGPTKRPLHSDHFWSILYSHLISNHF
jgi:hypothetical protein